MTFETTSFEGYECVRLQGERITLFVTVSAGPRIIGLTGSGDNLMAVVPEALLERPSGPPFKLMGGHRLWAAPEVPAITYEPDERPCTVAEIGQGVRVEGPADGAGLVKALDIGPDGDGWVVDHEIRNDSGAVVELAPWAITQLRLGGRVELPFAPSGIGPQADRSLVLWPYTDLGDPRLGFERDGISIRAEGGHPTLKIGLAPSEGRVAYRIGGEVFEKRAEIDPGARYPDRGAAVQVYLCDDFCELETLGPLTVLEHGSVAMHRETWTLREAAA